MKWIRMRDRLPPHGEDVLILASGMPQENTTLNHAYLFATYCADEGWYCSEYPDWNTPIVTHWMPLPEPPKEDTQ